MQLTKVPSFWFELSEVDISLQDVFYHFIAIISKKPKETSSIKVMNKSTNNVNNIRIQLLQICSNWPNVILKNYYNIVLAHRIMFETQNKAPKWQLLKELCLQQNRQFQEWQKQKEYDRFHNSHYDWWAFPINRRSSYGDKYQLSFEDKNVLIKDQQYLQALRSNAIMVCESWGYDLVKGEDIQLREKDQKWQDWPIRLYKLANSLQFFSEMDLFFNAIKYGLKLIKEGNDFTYGPKNLKPLFFRNQQILQQRERTKMDKKDLKCESMQKISNLSLGNGYEVENIEQKLYTPQQCPKQMKNKNQSQ